MFNSVRANTSTLPPVEVTWALSRISALALLLKSMNSTAPDKLPVLPALEFRTKLVKTVWLLGTPSPKYALLKNDSTSCGESKSKANSSAAVLTKLSQGKGISI